MSHLQISTFNTTLSLRKADKRVKKTQSNIEVCKTSCVCRECVCKSCGRLYRPETQKEIINFFREMA